MIELANVSFGYHEDTVLDNISLKINRHEYICIVGGNGSGKSTLAKILAGILKPVKGNISINQKIVSRVNVDDLRKQVGYVFANPNQQSLGDTVAEDLAFGLETHQVPRNEMAAKIRHVADLCQIQHLLTQKMSALSGGEKQRVAVASILILEPQILIFDEATSMLDPTNKKIIRTMMYNQYLKGHTVVEITHDLNDLNDADRVIWLENGRVVFDDRPDFLHNLPDSYPLPFRFEFAKQLKKYDLIDKISSNEQEILEQLDHNLK